jgi:hypothetical protein
MSMDTIDSAYGESYPRKENMQTVEPYGTMHETAKSKGEKVQMHATNSRLVTNIEPHDPFGTEEVSRMRELLRRDTGSNKTQYNTV